MESYKLVRSTNKILREEFSATYVECGTNIEGDFAVVDLYEQINFKYTDCTSPSFIGVRYSVYLYDNGTDWIIYDLKSNSSSDLFLTTDYELSSILDSTLSVSAIEKPESNEASFADVLQVNETEDTSDTFQYVPYSFIAADYYASSFTQNSTTNGAYYNDLFTNYNSLGGDCMNFVSQCVWAGFGGNVDATSISNGHMMDTTGSTWYHKSSDNRSNWTAPRDFWNYINASTSSPDTEDRIMVDETTLANTYSISTLNPNSFVSDGICKLNGAVLIEYSSGNYPHAVLINSAGGNDASGIYISGHNDDCYNVKLTDMYFSSQQFKLVIPEYFRKKDCSTAHTHYYEGVSGVYGFDSTCWQSGCEYRRMSIETVPIKSFQYVQGNQNTYQIGFYCESDIQPFRMAAKIEYFSSGSFDDEADTVTWLGEVTGSYTYSKTYEVTRAGLYRVTFYLRDCDDVRYASVSSSISRSYAFRAY